VTICVLPISAGIDAADFTRALRARQPETVGNIAVLTAQQLALTPEMNPASPVWRRHGIISRILDQAEEENTAVYLVADHEDSAWTRFCLQHADEVLMLADAAAEPAPSAMETALLHGDAPISMARQTLVLLHDAEAVSPQGTRRWLEPRNRPRHVHIRPALDVDMARLARIVSGRAIGLVFAGGGARGFAHVGVYQALEEAGVEIDFIGGSSIGALMGTMVALDLRGDAMREGVHEAFLNYPGGNITGDYSPFPLLSLIRGNRSRDSLARAIRHHAGEEIDMEDSWKTFFVIASNYSAGSEEVLRDGPIVRNVTASFAIPGVLPPVLRDGQLLYDGATFNNFPVDVMAEMGVGKVIGVDVSGEFGRKAELETLPGVMALLLDKLRPRKRQRYRHVPTVPETMLTSSFVTSLSRQREQRRFADLLFKPTLPRMGLMDWHRFEQVVDAGRAHARDVLSGMSAEALAAYR
jgi:NTE family protein